MDPSMRSIPATPRKPRVRMYPAHKVAIRNGKAVRIPAPPPADVDVIHTIRKAVALAARERCDTCHGRGEIAGGNPNNPHTRIYTCTRCSGTGELA